MHYCEIIPLEREEDREIIEKAVAKLQTCEHHHLAKVTDFFIKDDKAHIISRKYWVNESGYSKYTFIEPYNVTLQFLLQSRTWPVRQHIQWVIQLSDALDYLQNLQPEPFQINNLHFLGIGITDTRKFDDAYWKNGSLQIVNFGLLNLIPRYSYPDVHIGGYHAPETYRGNFSPQTDVYLLGYKLIHMLTAIDPRLKVPFAFAIDSEYKDDSASNALKDISEHLNAVIMKAIMYDPEKRYASPFELKRDLAILLEILPPDVLDQHVPKQKS